MSGSSLTRVGDIVQIVVCLVILALAANVYYTRSRLGATEQRGRLAVGSKLPPLPGVSYASRPLTLVLFQRSTCQFCTQSMPLYASLAQTIDRNRIQFVSASPEDKSVSERYLQQHNVSLDAIVQLDAAVSYPIEGTPTMVLVDKDGTVRHSWVGLLDAQSEKDVKHALLSR